MRRHLFEIAWIVASIAVLPALSERLVSDQLGLNPGSYWIYRGTVQWTDPGEPVRTHTKQIKWKVEILEKTRHSGLDAYLVNGRLDHLPWFEPNREPGKYLWIIYRGRFFTPAVDGDLLRRFRDAADPLIDAIQQDDPVLQFPLRLDSCTVPSKPDDSEKRDDLFYCWHLEQKTLAKLHAIGVSLRPITVWTVWYRSQPDHEILAFAPGVGFVSSDFGHHGTLSEAHIRLIEAHLRSEVGRSDKI